MKAHRRKWLILIILIVVNLLFFLIRPGASVSYDPNLFALSDTSRIDRIRIGDSLFLEKNDEWEINGQKGDQALIRLFLSVMINVKVKKPADAEGLVSIGEAAFGDAYAIHVYSNPTRTRTYFQHVDEDEAYEVHIPGYNEYLGSIFELEPGEWRDRLLINANWRTVQLLELDYSDPSREDIMIRFEDDFFKVRGLAAIDSNAVVEYLAQFQQFYVDAWTESLADSRWEANDIARLKIETIDSNNPQEWKIKPAVDGKYPVLLSDGQGVQIGSKRMGNLLIDRKDLKYEE